MNNLGAYQLQQALISNEKLVFGGLAYHRTENKEKNTFLSTLSFARAMCYVIRKSWKESLLEIHGTSFCSACKHAL